MHNMNAKSPLPANEPVLNYLPGSDETKTLKSQLKEFLSTEIEVPVIINGKEIRTGKTENMIVPHDHQHKLGIFHTAGEEEVRAAITGSREAWKSWSLMRQEARSAIFLKAAELLATKYRPILNASTMLGQSKTCYQAEIDAACELVDFFRFNVHFQEQMYSMQPNSAKGQWNQLEFRAMEGFVFSVTPFNFTSIAGNLPTSAALMGNVSLWKPASTSIYSSYFIMKLLHEAGLPPGVIQFIPGSGAMIGNLVLKDRDLAGVHFTGSTGVFQEMWKTIGENIKTYRSYPRIVGETGGKDFVFVHASADVDVVATALVRGAFEYQGQKCSAASRAYIPKSLWKNLKDKLVSEVNSIKQGDVTDFKNFMSAVIDKKSFTSLKKYIDEAKASPQAEVIAGGKCDDSKGYFIAPTVIEVKDPKYRTMCEELFGPVLTLYVYDDKDYEATLKICDETSPYALTGAIISQDRESINIASRILSHSAGNFYINNKPTGAVVGQQPFGGSRASGTNDKAGSIFNLLRWVSVRTVSETFSPPSDYRYPFMS